MSKFPDGWKPTVLKDSGQWLSGGTPSTTTAEYWGGDIPWISSGSLTNFRLWNSDRRVTALGAENGTRIVNAGTILMVVRGMSLKTEFRLGIAQRDMAFGQDCKALVAGPGIDPEFLAYAISARSQFILGIVDEAGHGTGRLNSDQLYAVEIGMPPLTEQRAIAEVLAALDDKIAANTKLSATADELLATRFESSVGSETPLVRLADIADVNGSTVKPVPGGHLKYVDIASVGVGSFEFPSGTRWEDAPSRARRSIGKGDTLWSTVRPNRRSHALNLADDPQLVGSTGLAVLTARTVGWAYLYEVTRRPEFTSYLEAAADGSAYPAVRADKFGEALVPLPDEASRRSFEHLAEPLREELHLLDRENRTLAATRDALLPQLMSGKLRVKDAEKVLEDAGV